MDDLVQCLTKKGVLRSPRIIEAFRYVDRAKFVLPEYASRAYQDEALPIPGGQTISQPYTVAFMLELLEPNEGDIIMDVGAGSGWQTSLLAYIVGEGGHVYSLEVVSELAHFGEENIQKFPELARRITWMEKDASGGLPEIAEQHGGFDKIIAAAEVKKVPEPWKSQLKVGGNMIYPKMYSIVQQTKNSLDSFERRVYPGFRFVPYRQ